MHHLLDTQQDIIQAYKEWNIGNWSENEITCEISTSTIFPDHHILSQYCAFLSGASELPPYIQVRIVTSVRPDLWMGGDERSWSYLLFWWALDVYRDWNNYDHSFLPSSCLHVPNIPIHGTPIGSKAQSYFLGYWNAVIIDNLDI